MPISPELIQSNSQIYRVYTRRLANPADEDIFITSAGKLAAFLSDTRAYYAEAQPLILEVLEVARNSLKNVAPSAFSKPDSMNRSAIPDDKAPLFDAFEKLVNSVMPYVHLFVDQSLSNRLRSFLSSIGISPSQEPTTIVISPDTPTEKSAPWNADFTATASQIDVASSLQLGTTSSDSASMPLGSSPVVKGQTNVQSISPEPTSAIAAQLQPVAPVEITDDDVAVIQSAPSQQIPASESLRQSPSSQAPVPEDGVSPVLIGPNRKVQTPASFLFTSPVPPSLPAQPPPVSVPQVALPSPHRAVTPTSASPDVMPHGQDSHAMSPSLASSGHAAVAQVSQVPPSQVPVPVRTPAPMAPVPQSSAQQPKPPPRRQSYGLNFLLVDLEDAREKKRAAALATGQQKSGSAARASPGSVSAPIAPTTVTSPTSTATAALPNAPAVPISISTALATAEVTPARTPPLTGATPVHTSTTSIPTLVHRNLRQGVTRNGSSSASPCKLRITDRAPAPAPEPGSSSAPIVIDEDDEPIRRPADEPMEIDSPIQTLPTSLKTETASDPQGVQGGNIDTGNDRIPRPERHEVTARPLVSEHGPSVTGTSRADLVAAQSPFISPLIDPRLSIATPSPATPVSGPSVPSGSEDGVPLQQAKDSKEQGKVAKVSVESLGRPTTEIVSDATIKPLLGSESSAMNVDPAHTTEDTEMTSTAPATTESSATLAASHDNAEPNSHLNITETHGTGEHATTSVTEASLAIGKHGRSLTPDDNTRRVVPRRELVSEIQQDAPTIVLQSEIVGSTSTVPVILDSEKREKEGGSEAVVDTLFQLGQVGSHTSSISGGGVGESMLAVPRSGPHSSSEPLSDMDISYSMTPPPIVVLGTRTGVSSPDSHSRYSSPQSGNEAGMETVKAEELEDEMVDELAPLFGKEMRVICMDRAWDVSGEFTWNIHLPQVDWDRVSKWADAPENLDSDISRVRCITLACYSMRELEPYATQEGLTREQWFENVKPVPWANLPPHIWGLINDNIIAGFPPYVSPDDLYDLSPYLRLGDNKITFTQIDGMEDYVLVLHGHCPTPAQLVPLHARWDQERKFLKQLQWFARPFTLDA